MSNQKPIPNPGGTNGTQRAGSNPLGQQWTPTQEPFPDAAGLRPAQATPGYQIAVPPQQTMADYAQQIEETEVQWILDQVIQEFDQAQQAQHLLQGRQGQLPGYQQPANDNFALVQRDHADDMAYNLGPYQYAPQQQMLQDQPQQDRLQPQQQPEPANIAMVRGPPDLQFQRILTGGPQGRPIVQNIYLYNPFVYQPFQTADQLMIVQNNSGQVHVKSNNNNNNPQQQLQELGVQVAHGDRPIVKNIHMHNPTLYQPFLSAGSPPPPYSSPCQPSNAFADDANVMADVNMANERDPLGHLPVPQGLCFPQALLLPQSQAQAQHRLVLAPPPAQAQINNNRAASSQPQAQKRGHGRDPNGQTRCVQPRQSSANAQAEAQAHFQAARQAHAQARQAHVQAQAQARGEVAGEAKSKAIAQAQAQAQAHGQTQSQPQAAAVPIPAPALRRERGSPRKVPLPDNNKTTNEAQGKGKGKADDSMGKWKPMAECTCCRCGNVIFWYRGIPQPEWCWNCGHWRDPCMAVAGAPGTCEMCKWSMEVGDENDVRVKEEAEEE